MSIRQTTHRYLAGGWHLFRFRPSRESKKRPKPLRPQRLRQSGQCNYNQKPSILPASTGLPAPPRPSERNMLLIIAPKHPILWASQPPSHRASRPPSPQSSIAVTPKAEIFLISGPSTEIKKRTPHNQLNTLCNPNQPINKPIL